VLGNCEPCSELCRVHFAWSGPHATVMLVYGFEVRFLGLGKIRVRFGFTPTASRLVVLCRTLSCTHTHILNITHIYVLQCLNWIQGAELSLPLLVVRSWGGHCTFAVAPRKATCRATLSLLLSRVLWCLVARASNSQCLLARASNTRRGTAVVRHYTHFLYTCVVN